MISECLKSQDKKYIYIYLNEKEKTKNISCSLIQLQNIFM